MTVKITGIYQCLCTNNPPEKFFVLGDVAPECDHCGAKTVWALVREGMATK